MRQHAHRREIEELRDAVLRVELECLHVEFVERVFWRVPVHDPTGLIYVGASPLGARHADREERNAEALECRIAVAARPERTCGASASDRRFAGDPFGGVARIFDKAWPSIGRHRIEPRPAPAWSIEVRVRDAVTIEIGPEAIDVPARRSVAPKRVSRPPREPYAAL